MEAEVLAVISRLNKHYKKELIKLGNQLPPVTRIPFTSPKMNYLTRGGMPRGRMVEFYGAEHSGKTTSALDLVAQAQSMGERAFFVDAENTLDEEWARKLGVDVDNLVIIKPQATESAEEILQAVIDLVETGMFGIGVVDSIPFLVPKAVLEGTMDDKSYCGNSGTLTQFTKKIIGLLAKTNTLLVMINQLRDKIGATFVSYNTPGGRALRHAYSFRLFFTKGRFIDDDCKELTNGCETAQGTIIEVKVEKNKVCKPDRRLGEYTLKFDSGIDIYNDTIEMGIFLKVGVMQSGAWYALIDENGEIMQEGDTPLKFQGKARLLEKLGTDDQLFQAIYERVCAAAIA